MAAGAPFFDRLQVARFAVVGLLATATYAVVATGAIYLLHLEATAASVLGYLVGIVVSFLGQSRHVFGVQQRRLRHVLRFAVQSVIGLAASYGCALLATDALGLAPIWGVVLTIAVAPALSFVLMKLWVFAPEPQTGP